MKNRDLSEGSPHAVEKPADVFYEDEMSPELKAALDEAIRDHRLGIGPRYSIEEVTERLYRCVGELL